jgi:hypothetical protein
VRSLTGIAGEPMRLTSSPDCSRILFEMATNQPGWLEGTTYRNATVWSLSVDGSELQLLATTRRENDPGSDSDDPKIDNPVFSLDGNSVVLTEDYFSGVTFVREWYSDDLYQVITLENSGLTYSISADGPDLRLPLGGSYPAQVMRQVDSEGSVVPMSEMVISTLSLTPGVAGPVENPGSCRSGRIS